MAGREFLGSQDFNYNSLPTKDMNKQDNEDRKQVGYGATFPLLSRQDLTYYRRSSSWKLWPESQQDYPRFVV